jgi:hypothetical protein
MPNLEHVKKIYLEMNASSKVNLVLQISSKLIYSNSRQLLFDLFPNPISRLSIYVQIFNLNPYTQTRSLLCQPLINSYENRLDISISYSYPSFESIFKISRSFEPNNRMKWQNPTLA